MSQTTTKWKQGFQLRPHHVEKQAIRILLIGDSVIAGTAFGDIFNAYMAPPHGKRFEIVEQITTEAMGWKFLLFLADEIRVDVDFVFVFLHAAETIAEPSKFRHVQPLFSHLAARSAAGVMPHVIVFRTPTGSSYGEFAPELCRLEEQIRQELGASLVEISSPASEMRGDGTHYTDEGIADLAHAVRVFCDRLTDAAMGDEPAAPAKRLAVAPKLELSRVGAERSGHSEEICRLYLAPSFRDMAYLLPGESIRVKGVGQEVLCLCFIGPYSGVIEVTTASGSHAITLADAWCTVSRPAVVSLSCSEERVEHDLQITLTTQIPRVKKYSLSERFDHEPRIDQSMTSFEFSLADYRYTGPTLFPFVSFCFVEC